MMDDPTTAIGGSSRKRSRSQAHTVATNNARIRLKGIAADLSDAATIAHQLLDSSKRNSTLNKLLQLSASHESNYNLGCDDVLNALVTIVYDDVFEWKSARPFRCSKRDEPSFHSKEAWTTHPTKACAAWARHCEHKLSLRCLESDRFKLYEMVLVILRNLSFVAANLRLMAYSPGVLSILIAALYESTASSNLCSEDDTTVSLANTNTNLSKLALPALYTFVNLTPYLDVSGQKLLADKLFLAQDMDPAATANFSRSNEECPPVPDTETFGQIADGSWGFGGLWLAKKMDTKEDTIQDVPKVTLLALTRDQLVWVWSIFPALCKVLVDPCTPRLALLQAIELLQEFIGHARVAVVGSIDDHDTSDSKIASSRAILVRLPKSVLDRLIQLLYVPRLGQEAMEYMDPTRNIVTRVLAPKLKTTYDTSVDTDIRDRVLDVLVPLLELDSPRLATQLATEVLSTGLRRPNVALFDTLLPILTTQVGRSEAPHLATQLLRELSRSKEAKVGLQYLEARMITLGSKDTRIAQLAMNHLFATQDKGAATAMGTAMSTAVSAAAEQKRDSLTRIPLGGSGSSAAMAPKSTANQN